MINNTVIINDTLPAHGNIRYPKLAARPPGRPPGPTAALNLVCGAQTAQKRVHVCEWPPKRKGNPNGNPQRKQRKRNPNGNGCEWPPKRKGGRYDTLPAHGNERYPKLAARPAQLLHALNVYGAQTAQKRCSRL